MIQRLFYPEIKRMEITLYYQIFVKFGVQFLSLVDEILSVDTCF